MLLLSVNNVTTNIVRQSIKYVKSFKQNYDYQLGLLTKNGSPFYYIYIMIARSLIHVKELNCYQLRLQQLSRSNRKIMPSSHRQRGHSILYYFFLLTLVVIVILQKIHLLAVIVIPCSFFY